MFRKIMLFAMCLALLASVGCVKTVEPGHTGIKISKIGSNRGVSQENIVSGWVFYFPLTTQVIEYPTFNQRVAWTASKTEGSTDNDELSFNTKDSVPVNMDVAVNYTLRADKVPSFYTKFRADKISLFTHGYLRDQARNAVSQIGSEYNFDDINGPKKEEFMTRISAALSASVNDFGVDINNKNGVSVIGALRPPTNLRDAINARVQAIQQSMKAENELRTVTAEAKKAVATAEGEAASMRAKSASITPQFMELRKLEIQEKAIAKWNGTMPATMMGSGSNVMFNIPMK
jgi:regulator of protease activity HflC (stomatin/prohibitin superfamily)